MRILLLGDYSNVHSTLAEGLRALGHCVLLASDGDGWKDYPRDVDLARPGSVGQRSFRQLLHDARYYVRLCRLFLTRFRGFDVVQVINPVFLPLRAERILPFYRMLRRNNKHVFMGAFGMDHYWVKAGLDCMTFRYSDFNFGKEVRHDVAENELFVRDWLDGPKGTLNKVVAADCDGIIAGLYEYWASYSAYLPQDERRKLCYIPFPIKLQHDASAKLRGDVTHAGSATAAEACQRAKVRFFVGIQRERNAYKGTDVMLRALDRLAADYPERVEVRKVENVPFAEYKRLLDGSDVILDQLYSYTPAMNALQAMSQGLVAVSGAEREYYDLQEGRYDAFGSPADAARTDADEAKTSSASTQSDVPTVERPIVNVKPDEDDVYRQLRWIVEHGDRLPALQQGSRDFVARYHDHIAVAKQYVRFWQSR